jgi:hypothetical protein
MFGLIDTISRNFLGKYGSNLLDFLLSHGFGVCVVVILYGSLLIFAQRNLDKIGKKVKNLEKDDLFLQKDPFMVLAAKDADFWRRLQKESQFPFIALSSSLLLYRINRNNLNKLLSRYILNYQQQQKLNIRSKK